MWADSVGTVFVLENEQALFILVTPHQCIKWRTKKSYLNIIWWTFSSLLSSHFLPRLIYREWRRVALNRNWLSWHPYVIATRLLSLCMESTVAHFTTLGAQKFMNRATRICINFCSSSNYVATRARGKWLTLGAKYRVFWAVSSAKFWVGPQKPDFQPYEAP